MCAVVPRYAAGRIAIPAPAEASTLTIGQAAARYLGTLPAGERERARSEISRFLEHIGKDRPLSQLNRRDVDRFQDRLNEAKVDQSRRIEPVKLFLQDLKKKKLTEDNLGAVLRVRKPKAGRGGERAEAPVIELTQAGHDQLTSELTQLESDEIPRLRDAVSLARADGDLRENAPYHEAKREMGVVQGRIDALRNQLGSSKIVARQQSTEKAGLGSRVVLRDTDYDEEHTFTLVGPGEVKPREGKISIQSPVGNALKGKSVGEKVEVDTPQGVHQYTVVRIERAE
ncbi:MAG: transcription elongation factor GreA [Chloroflexi bacterium]|nr:transcription elongation factor GreA [Chloroflexota bacterium]